MKAILLRQNKLRRAKEYFWTIGLSSEDDIEYIELISIGNYRSTEVDPVEVFSIAVNKKRNYRLIGLSPISLPCYTHWRC